MAPGETQGGGKGPQYSPLALAGLGFELLAPILLCGWVGYRLDQWRGTQPGFLVGGLLLGIVVSLAGFFRRVWPTGDGGGGNQR